MFSATERTAPYAPSANVLNVIRSSRKARLSDPLSVQELARIGIPEGNGPRTLQTLRHLDIVDDEGHRRPNYERIRVATSQDYPSVLADILREAYQDVFAVIDPATATDVEIHDAFRGFKPESQTYRMVLLFTSLCREAGIISGGPPETRTRSRNLKARNGKVATAPSSRVPSGSQVTQDDLPQPTLIPEASPLLKAAHRSAASSEEIDDYYEPLTAFLRQLPSSHKWTAKRQKQWLHAITAAVEWLIEVVDEDEGGIEMPS